MDRKNWNNLLDKYLIKNSMSSEEYEELNQIQKAIIQELKKSFKRIKKHQHEN